MAGYLVIFSCSQAIFKKIAAINIMTGKRSAQAKL